MEFLILTTYGQYIIEADDFQQAADHCYDNHTGYDDVQGIIKLEG